MKLEKILRETKSEILLLNFLVKNKASREEIKKSTNALKKFSKILNNKIG